MPVFRVSPETLPLRGWVRVAFALLLVIPLVAGLPRSARAATSCALSANRVDVTIAAGSGISVQSVGGDSGLFEVTTNPGNAPISGCGSIPATSPWSLYAYGLDGTDELVSLQHPASGDPSLYPSTTYISLAGSNSDNDTVLVYGSSGADTMSAGAVQNDVEVLVFYGEGGNDTITMPSTSLDAATAQGGPGDDTLIGSNNGETLLGQDGDDFIEPKDGADTVSGGAGLDTIDYETSVEGMTIDLKTQTATGGDATGDSISGFESAQGGSGDDTITGSSADNDLYGGGGTDTLNGGRGADDVYGEDGTDYLNGNGGADRLYGGDGDDVLYYGGGVDSMNGGEGAETQGDWCQGNSSGSDGLGTKKFGRVDYVDCEPMV